MATAAQIAQFRETNAAIEALSDRSLQRFFNTLDLSRPRHARDALLEFVPALTTEFGEMSSLVAADWFDELRSAEDLPRAFRAQMAAATPTDVVQQRVKYGARHLFTPTPELLLPFLQGAVQGYVLQPGRDTIQRSSIADPDAAGWHRETRPSETFASGCGFCNVLAGRGGVYKWDTAQFASHDNCHCVAVPSWDQGAEEVPASAYVASARTAGWSQADRDAHNAVIRDLAALEDTRR